MSDFEKVRRLRENLERREDERSEAALNTPEGEAARKARNEAALEELRKRRRREAARARRAAYEGLGMRAVRGSAGGRYWE